MRIQQSAKNLVEELAGSVAIPKKFQGLSIDKVIGFAKQRYFRARKKENKRV